MFKGDNQGQDFGDVEPGEKFVRIYWTDGLTHDSPIIAYTVEFRTNFDQRWRVHPDADRELAKVMTVMVMLMILVMMTAMAVSTLMLTVS